MVKIEELEKDQLLIKLREVKRQLDIKTISLVETKNLLHATNQRLRKYKTILIKNHKNLMEELENE